MNDNTLAIKCPYCEAEAVPISPSKTDDPWYFRRCSNCNRAYVTYVEWVPTAHTFVDSKNLQEKGTLPWTTKPAKS